MRMRRRRRREEERDKWEKGQEEGIERERGKQVE